MVSIIALVLIVGGEEEGIGITIHNHLDHSLTNLKVEYPQGSITAEVAGGAKVKLQVYPKYFGEGAVTLQYDAQGVKQQETIFGYMEDGFSGEAEITIKSVKPNGQLEMLVQAD